MKIILFASGRFALPCLQRLCDSDTHCIVRVITTPPAPAGRRYALRATPVEEAARAHNLPVAYDITPEQAAADADCFVVCDYRRLLPQALLDAAPQGVLNIHPSLLPRHRGAAPITRAILDGDNETGVSIMELNARLDAGDIIAQTAVPIRPHDTGGSLHDTLAQRGAELLLEVLRPTTRAARHRAYPPRQQDAAAATYAKPTTAADRELHFNQPAAALLRAVRAFAPAPAAHCIWRGERIKVHAAEAAANPAAQPPGTLIAADRQRGIVIACQPDAIRLLQLQRAGRKKLAAGALLNAPHPFHP